MIKNSGIKYDDYSISPKIPIALGLWINRKKFLAVKLIYNNSIKYR